MRVVVCDTGPILHLHEAHALHLLDKTGEVFAPPVVDREIARHLHDWAARRPGWLRVESPQHPLPGHLEQWAAEIDLGPGEMEAIVLAKSRAADWLLTDDAAARVVAARCSGSRSTDRWASSGRPPRAM